MSGSGSSRPRSCRAAFAPVADVISRVQSATMRTEWALILVPLISYPAFATDGGLCRALDVLKEEAARSGPQRMTVLKRDDETMACGWRTDAALAVKAFCNAAVEPVGVEFTHKYPWLIYDCLRGAHLRPSVTTVDQYTGMKRKKVVHLWAGWRDGARLDIRFVPKGDAGPQPKFRDYWGDYELVIWRA
jgi:hypothetical protein